VQSPAFVGFWQVWKQVGGLKLECFY